MIVAEGLAAAHAASCRVDGHSIADYPSVKLSPLRFHIDHLQVSAAWKGSDVRYQAGGPTCRSRTRVNHAAHFRYHNSPSDSLPIQEQISFWTHQRTLPQSALPVLVSDMDTSTIHQEGVTMLCLLRIQKCCAVPHARVRYWPVHKHFCTECLGSFNCCAVLGSEVLL